MTALSLLIIVLVCLFGWYQMALIGDVLAKINDLKYVKPSTTQTNLEGKLEYNEIQIYSKHIKGELLCFIKYSYFGEVIRERAIDDFAVSYHEQQDFNFVFTGMIGYI